MGKLRYNIGDGTNHQHLDHIAQSIHVPSERIYKFLRNESSNDMIVDGTSTPVPFNYTVPANKIGLLALLNIHVSDGKVDPDTFGGLDELTNGVKVEIYDTDGTTVLLDMLDGDPVKHNDAWANIAGAEMATFKATGGTAESWVVTWDLTKSGGLLHLTAGQSLRATIQDALAGLVDFKMLVRGLLLDV